MKMRKLIAILSAVMMLCALLPVGAMTVSAADAVLFDDFSDGNTDGWSCSETIVVDNGAMKWTTASWKNLYRNIKVTANTDYVLTFKMKATKERTVEFKFLNGSWDSSGITSYPSTSATAWADYTYEFNSGNNTSLVLLLQSHSAMDIYLDDIKIAEPETEQPETPEEPTVSNVLVNGDFETGNLNGWNNYSGTTVTSAKVHGGSYAMTSGNTASKYQTMTKQVFAVTPNTDYTLTFWCYYEGSNAQPSFYTYIQNADGNSLSSKTTYPSPSGAWEQVTVTFNPGELTSLVLYVKNRTAEDGGTYYFDDFMIPNPVAEEPETPDVPGGATESPVAGNLVQEGTFENGKTTGWSLHGGSAASTSAPYAGSYGLHGKGSGWNGIANTTVTLEVGKSYKLTYWYKINVAGFNWKLSGVTTSTKYAGTWQNSNLGTWQKIEVEFVADDSSAKLNFSGLDESSSPDFYLDSVSIVEIQGPSNDGFILNGDFEVGKTTGWNIHQNTKVSAEAANNSAYGINLIGNGGWGGMLDQAFKTTKGLKYILTFDLKVNNYGVNMQVRNKADDANLASRWFDSNCNTWTTYTFEFTAVSTDTYLNFCGGGGGSSTGGEDVYVDNIQIVEIPCEHQWDSEQDADCNICGHIREVPFVVIMTAGGNSASEDVKGLAFKFDIEAYGAAVDNNNKYTGEAMVKPYGNDDQYKLVTMGAVITNKAENNTEDKLNLNTVNGKTIIDVEAVYLLDTADVSASFAARIINIPEGKEGTTIYARCYYVFEKNGEQIVIYGDIVSNNYAAVIG